MEQQKLILRKRYRNGKAIACGEEKEMSYEIRWLERALNELKESYDWYEQKVPDLGARFHGSNYN